MSNLIQEQMSPLTKLKEKKKFITFFATILMICCDWCIVKIVISETM